jgi:RHH-type proline utilization regulon transcriptional repressor/proline dehydrogenase/delta 1-pyrroline-5-carboxylate dehydrogenase
VLHVATFKGKDILKVVNTINAQNYGLTFGLHSRVDSRVQQLVSHIKAGNAYVNRNQIGAIVGSQPFGGEGLSGTGPKAGGPHYLKRFYKEEPLAEKPQLEGSNNPVAAIESDQLQQLINQLSASNKITAWMQRSDRRTQLRRWIEETLDTSLINEGLLSHIDSPIASIQMPGPTGELNVLSETARGLVLCVASHFKVCLKLTLSALSQGNSVLMLVADQDESYLAELNAIADHLAIPVNFINASITAKDLSYLQGFSALTCDADTQVMRDYRIALASRKGMLIPLINECSPERYVLERHLCVDTTAAGGNASLIGAVED